jgi:tetratricopeptide (TPR) repeat protein
MSGSGAASAAGKVGRNDPCPCGSGRKYKHCCESKPPAADPLAARAQPSPAASKVKAEAMAKAASARRLWAADRRAEAIVAFQEAARLEPSNPDAHYDLGAACFHEGRLSEAVEAFRCATGLRPGFGKALQPLGAALVDLGRAREASAVYRKLSRMADDAVSRRLSLASALALDGELEEAERELRRVIAVAPKHAGAQFLLGRLLLWRGSFEEAELHLIQVVDVVPPAFQFISDARRMTEADRPLVERMLAHTERTDLAPIHKGTIHFGLGKAFDDLGDYEAAMRHYEAGSRLKAASARIDRAAMAGYYDIILSDFSADGLGREKGLVTKPAGPDDELPVFIVGMPRSGSTLVEQILSSHPAVAAGGELSFWIDRINAWLAPSAKAVGVVDPLASVGAEPPSGLPFAETAKPILGGGQASDWLPFRFDRVEAGPLTRAAEDYLALLREIGPKALRVTDKALSNFERLGPIRLALPGARIIHCRRHPVDTCLSIFFTAFNSRTAWDRDDIVFQYRQYERLMEHWRRVLPADRFTEVEYEALVVDREAETRRLIAFCGLEWDDACLAPERNLRAVKTASVWQARQPVYKTSLERWRRYEPWLGEFRNLLPANDVRESQGTILFG